MKFTLAQLQQLAASAGFQGEDAKIAAAIAMAESGGNPNALCDSCAGVTEYSVGLFQVNILAWPRWTANEMYVPAQNAAAAYTIWKTAGGFGPWSTFTSGAYKRWYTPPAPAAPASKWGDRLLVAAGIAAGLGLVALAVHEIRSPGALLPGRA